MRAFVALVLKEEVKDYLETLQLRVKEQCRRGNFTPKNNFHVTLHFLGEVNNDDLDGLRQAVLLTAERNSTFNLSLNQMGVFPRGDSGVVWVGIAKNNKLDRLFEGLERNLSKQGFSREKKGLTPHITLGRDVVAQGNLIGLAKKIEVLNMEMAVEEIALMESVRVGGKLIYRPLLSQPLRARIDNDK